MVDVYDVHFLYENKKVCLLLLFATSWPVFIMTISFKFPVKVV